MKSSNPALPSTDQNAVSELIQTLVDASPSRGRLTADDLATVAKAVVFDELKDELKHRLDVARIDLAAKRELFLSRYRSQQTRKLIELRISSRFGRSGLGSCSSTLSPACRCLYASCTGSRPLFARIAAASSFFTFLIERLKGEFGSPS